MESLAASCIEAVRGRRSKGLGSALKRWPGHLECAHDPDPYGAALIRACHGRCAPVSALSCNVDADLRIPRVQGCLQRHDKLWNDGQRAVARRLQQVRRALRQGEPDDAPLCYPMRGAHQEPL